MIFLYVGNEPPHLSNLEPNISAGAPSIYATGGSCHIEKKGTRVADGRVDLESSLDTSVSKCFCVRGQLTVLPAATVRVPVVLAAAPLLQIISVDCTLVTGPLEYISSGTRI
jgi:hypothetical protein